MSERDFIGYGQHPPKVEWPNGARIAVSIVVNYEEGSEYSLLDGDPHRETNSEVPSPLPLDERDLANESFFEYGSRAGVWRIMRTLKRFDVPATFYCCALALERNPEVGPEIVRQGHEVFGHGYRWEEYYRMDRDDEREAIAKGCRVHTPRYRRASAWLVHEIRPELQHPRTGRRGGRIPLRFQLVCRRHPLLCRSRRQTLARSPLLARGQRHSLLAWGHEQSHPTSTRRSRTPSTSSTKKAPNPPRS